jgi:hypothetical protein
MLILIQFHSRPAVPAESSIWSDIRTDHIAKISRMGSNGTDCERTRVRLSRKDDVAGFDEGMRGWREGRVAPGKDSNPA